MIVYKELGHVRIPRTLVGGRKGKKRGFIPLSFGTLRERNILLRIPRVSTGGVRQRQRSQFFPTLYPND